MEEPNYVLKTYERIDVPKNDTALIYYTKRMIWIVYATIIIWSIFSGELLFLEMNRASLITLLIGTAAVYKISKRQGVPAPLVLQFYDDYLIINKGKHYYNRKCTRMEIDKIYYKDIRKCQYKTIAKRILFFGMVEGIWYDYKKDGTVPDQPTYHKTTDSMSSFYTDMAPEVDFVAEIEAHSPIKVTIEKDI